MVTIITGTTNKPMASEALKGFFHANEALDGYLYIGYPIIGTVDGTYDQDVAEDKLKRAYYKYLRENLFVQ